MIEDKSKKIFLSVLGVAILLVAVVGISFAVFNYDKTGSANSIQVGSITMTYTEAKNGIALVDALPMLDADGLALTGTDGDGNSQVFEFSVSASATGDGTINIPYAISVTPNTTGDKQLANDEVHIALFTKADNGSLTQVDLFPSEDKKDDVISALADSTLRVGSKVLYDTSVSATSTLSTTNYVLKIWVDQDVNPDKFTESYSYSLLVNVDTHGTTNTSNRDIAN